MGCRVMIVFTQKSADILFWCDLWLFKPHCLNVMLITHDRVNRAIVWAKKRQQLTNCLPPSRIYLYFIKWHFQWKRWNGCALMWTNRLSWMASYVCARMCACGRAPFSWLVFASSEHDVSTQLSHSHWKVTKKLNEMKEKKTRKTRENRKQKEKYCHL